MSGTETQHSRLGTALEAALTDWITNLGVEKGIPFTWEHVRELERISERLNVLERGHEGFAWNQKLDIDALRTRITKMEKALYNLDTEALKQPITAKDIDRWRRIEKAARAYVFNRCPDAVPSWTDLIEALKR